MKNVYIITGTSRGLGSALVEKLLKSDDNHIFCLQRCKCENTKNKTYIQVDLAKIEDLAGVMEEIFDNIDKKELSSITLINNAGVLSPIKSIHETSVEDISSNIDINLKALVILTSTFLRKTKDLDIYKAMVNISSGAAVRSYDGWSVYCASKAGVDMFTSVVALEQDRQEFPTIICALHPGVMDTEMQQLIRSSEEKDFPSVEKFVNYKNEGKLLSAKSISAALLKFIEKRSVKNGKIYSIEEIM